MSSPGRITSTFTKHTTNERDRSPDRTVWPNNGLVPHFIQQVNQKCHYRHTDITPFEAKPAEPTSAEKGVFGVACGGGDSAVVV
jgi:hypothetical protein